MRVTRALHMSSKEARESEIKQLQDESIESTLKLSELQGKVLELQARRIHPCVLRC